ncbi:hypothetical protein I302_104074 [Kwoniella bestiolae CBS 10118]|uniref:Phenazine biosynthesis protein n=1 Tax=Kwoniella bestiolae CBS 10118 TaxID=1296100 RepID=A0A1B9GA85_9TREE|nr:hypothetical protein I302_02779 [Kwoniella bestiolae CBS 10118]OCF27929.1 hypothetical protein I302_02779 [Kwoniella bestiolae CBS 10118]
MSSPQLQFHLLNAFVVDSNPHSGNQAAVVLFSDPSDHRAEDEKWMTSVARDFGFSETAYLVPLALDEKGDKGEWGLRWFTPEVEVTLCGHATLASSKVLFSLNPALQLITFQTRFSGTLTARRVGQEEVEISLPTLSNEVISKFGSTTSNDDETRALEGAFGLDRGGVVGVEEIDFSGNRCLIVQLSQGVDVEKIRVDIKALVAITGCAVITQVDNSKSIETGELHINSRVFGPALGVDEDPVTGSSHAHLTGYYLLSQATAQAYIPKELLAKVSSPKELTVIGHQRSSRGGLLKCQLDAEDQGKVKIVGNAFEFGRGTLNL